MKNNRYYDLEPLPYGYKDLEPYMSEEVVRLHHDKHQQAYVTAANAIIEKVEKARASGEPFDFKGNLKALSFNVGGIELHELFWQMMAPAGAGGSEPVGNFGLEINREFGSLDRFKNEFADAAISVEGSGWAALTVSEKGRLMIAQIEKHNVNSYPTHFIILPLDVWEHAYYLDYKNDRAKFVASYWNLVNWEEASRRYDKIRKALKGMNS